MALLEITADDRAAAARYGAVNRFGFLVATGWEPQGRKLVPFFHYSTGKRVSLLALPDGHERYARLYPTQH